MKFLIILLCLCLVLATACTTTHKTYVISTGTGSSSLSGGNATDTIYLTTYCDASPCEVLYWVTQT